MRVEPYSAERWRLGSESDDQFAAFVTPGIGTRLCERGSFAEHYLITTGPCWLTCGGVVSLTVARGLRLTEFEKLCRMEDHLWNAADPRNRSSELRWIAKCFTNDARCAILPPWPGLVM